MGLEGWVAGLSEPVKTVLLGAAGDGLGGLGATVVTGLVRAAGGASRQWAEAHRPVLARVSGFAVAQVAQSLYAGDAAKQQGACGPLAVVLGSAPVSETLAAFLADPVEHPLQAPVAAALPDNVSRALATVVPVGRSAERVLSDLLAEFEQGARQEPALAWLLAQLRYAHHLRALYDTLQLDALDHDGPHYTMHLWDVFVPQTVRGCAEYLPRLFDQPREHLRRLREQGLMEGPEPDEETLAEWQRSYVEQAPRPVLELLAEPAWRAVVILGDPGAGKSTLVRRQALEWARAPETWPEAELPLLIELRLYARARAERGEVTDFLSYLRCDHGGGAQLDAEELDRCLRHGRAVVYFDGLDEVFDPAQRDEVVREIISFAVTYDRARVVVTSRVIGYQGEPFRRAEFRQVMLQDLDDEQQTAFLTAWHAKAYGAAAAPERDEKHRRLAQAIEATPAIRELAGNPLLLTMMAILNRHRDLPRDRADLYRECARLLLVQWRVADAIAADPTLARDREALGLDEKMKILRRAAREMQSGAQGLAGNAIARQRLEAIIAEELDGLVQSPPRQVARALIRHLRERNLILCPVGGDCYGFIHRTFADFYCADDLCARIQEPRSLSPDDLKQVYTDHWADERWEEVLVLLAGLVHENDVAALVAHLLAQPDRDYTARHVLLAARCVGQARNRARLADVGARALAAVKKLVSFELPYSYIDFGPEACQVDEVRRRAVVLVVEVWSTDADTFRWLRARAETDGSGAVRAAAAEALARGWRDDPETVQILRALAETDDAWPVRRAAVAALVRGWRNDPETLRILRARAETDEDRHVRQAAVEALARGWRDDPETLRILRARAETDESGSVRQAAVAALSGQ